MANGTDPRDEVIIRTDEAAESSSGSRRLFDIRKIIGALFVVYGVVLTIAGLADGSAEVHKAAGIRINLWTGLAMLVVGIGFLVWGFTTPSEIADDDEPSTGDAAGPG